MVGRQGGYCNTRSDDDVHAAYLGLVGLNLLCPQVYSGSNTSLVESID